MKHEKNQGGSYVSVIFLLYQQAKGAQDTKQNPINNGIIIILGGCLGFQPSTVPFKSFLEVWLALVFFFGTRPQRLL